MKLPCGVRTLRIYEVDVSLRGPGVATWMGRHFHEKRTRFFVPTRAAVIPVEEGASGEITLQLQVRDADDEFLNTAEAAQGAIEQLSQLPDAELFAAADLQISVRLLR